MVATKVVLQVVFFCIGVAMVAADTDSNEDLEQDVLLQNKEVLEGEQTWKNAVTTE